MSHRDRMIHVVAASIQEKINCSEADSVKAAEMAVEALMQLPDSVIDRAIQLQHQSSWADVFGHQVSGQRLRFQMAHTALMTAVIEDQGGP